MTSDDDNARSDVIERLFYLLTAAAEDAANIAAKGQSSRIPLSERRTSAAELRCAGEKIEILAAAIELLCVTGG